MYTRSSSAVKLNGHVTYWFECNQGVHEGDTLSPTSRGLYVNNLVGSQINTNSRTSPVIVSIHLTIIAIELFSLQNASLVFQG